MFKQLIYIIKTIKVNKSKVLFIETASILLLLINLFMTFALTFIFARVISCLFFYNEENRTLIYFFLFVFLNILNSIISYIQYMLMQKLGKEVSISLKKYLYKSILNKKIEFWNNYTVGELETILVNDVNKLEYIFTSLYSSIVINILTILGISCVLIYVLHFYGFIIIGLVLITILIQRVFVKKIEKLSNTVRDLAGITAAIETESLMKSEDIYMTGFQEKFLSRFFEKNVYLSDKIVKRNRLVQISSISTSLVQMINIIILLFTGAMLIRSDAITMETGISMYVFIQRLNAPINQMISQIINIIEILPSINRITELISNDDNISWGTKTISTPIKYIEYRNVTFRYPGQQTFLFANFNYIIRSTEKKVIIVGENGTGKSTMIRLLFNLCKPLEGCIKINGIDVNDLSEQTVRNHISFVSQVPLVVAGTIRDNLNIHEEYELEKAELILKCLGISSNWIDEKKDLIISDKRNNFSGGELQKIAITRAILENKDVIFMDEPTSSLDERAVISLLKLLDDYLSDKLVIIVTHDERVVKWGNYIVDLHKE